MFRTRVVLVAASLLLVARTAGGQLPTGGVKTDSWKITLTAPDEPGEPFILEGRILSLPDSLPVRNASLFLYQQDASGVYSATGWQHPRIAGTLRTNFVGGFRVRTVFPGRSEGVPHVHFVLTPTAGQRNLGTLAFCRLRGAGSDTVLAHLSQMLELPTNDHWAYVDRDADGVLHANARLYVHKSGGY